MVTILTASSLLISFLVTLLITPYWIRRATFHGLTARDMHKKEGSAAELGGLTVVCGMLAGVLFYIAIDVFIYGNGKIAQYLLAAITSILIATIIGFTDDILGWKIGLRQYQKVILTIAIALPMMVINAGHSKMALPFLGNVEFGLFYPLFLVPVGIIGASNAFNMIAGYNGLETGLATIILSTLGYLAFSIGAGWVAVLAFCLVAACIAFLVFNLYPAKVFPGDTFTYTIGTVIGIVAILGNIEAYALILLIPYMAEFALKARGRMQKESFARVLPNGSLTLPYRKYYGLEHIAVGILRKIKGRALEAEVVYLLWGFQMIFALIALAYRFIILSIA
ncbi:MAG TPA: glycosyl transferase family 4 [Candidatus Nanoarchaeia archaeon]|nr:glycosyl transferase family 4 [Candidatus Nanoarchaeia archaeon]